MDINEYREGLISKISRCQAVVTDLSQAKGFEYVVEDVKKSIQQIDDNWHFIQEGDDWANKIKELRLTKMASGYIVNLVNVYKEEMKKYQEELEKIDNPDKEVHKDFDTE